MTRSHTCRALVLCVTLAACAGGPAHARDFPEPRELADPWFAISGAPTSTPARALVHLVPAGYGDLAYHDYAILSGPDDSFSVRARAGGVPVAAGPLALGVYWSSVLLVGPVSPEDDPASIALWWMNAVQFEYGLIAAARLPRSHSLSLEYGRRSQHPLRGGYSEIAADVVRASAWLAPVELGLSAGRAFALSAGAALSYLDLFDFWQSDLLRPRTRFRLALPLDTGLRLAHIGSAAVEIYLAAEPRLLFLRQVGVAPGTDVEPAVQFELDAELGARVTGGGHVAVALELFTTRDTEQLRPGPAPLTTMGVVVRIGSQR